MLGTRLRSWVLGLSESMVSFERRGFTADSRETRRHLELIGTAFVAGYNAALDAADLEALIARLNTTASELRGFAFEGAAMALTILDLLLPWRRRFAAFLSAMGRPHVYVVHVGAGWAYARLRIAPSSALTRMDPLLKWLVVDGYGFHEGFFHSGRHVLRQRPPRGFSGYALRAFDQGLGRSLWFVYGASGARIADAIARFPPSRWGDLWSGIGLACAYAGGAENSTLELLARRAGSHRADAAQGAAFAAKARLYAGTPSLHTERACAILCNMGARDAAALCDASLRGLQGNGAEPAYELWRQRIRSRVA